MQRVTSRQNERLREVARLIESSRDRRKSGRCVLEGAHLIDVYTARVGAPETLVVVDDRLDDPAIAMQSTHSFGALKSLDCWAAAYAELRTGAPAAACSIRVWFALLDAHCR